MTIAEIRKAAGMTRTQAAQALGIPYQTLTNWERGNVPAYIVKMFDAALRGSPPEYLKTETGYIYKLQK